MALATTTQLYGSHDEAARVVRDLESAGFSSSDISIVSANDDLTYSEAASDSDTSGAGTGAAIGGVVGGGAGLLAGLGVMAIPGIGPVVAAGWLAATALGAVAGAASLGLLGALVDAGVSERDAHVYAEGVRRGGAVVTLRYESSREDEAFAIMRAGSPIDAGERDALLREEGWTRFDDTGMPYPRPPAPPAEDVRRRL